MGEIRVNQDQGTQLLLACFKVTFPDKIDKENFAPNVRSRIHADIRILKRALQEHSDLLKDEEILLFGPSVWYKKIEKQARPGEERVGQILSTSRDHLWEFNSKYRTATIKVILSARARKGLAAILLLWGHPGPCFYGQNQVAYVQVPGQQDNVLWPLAEQLKCVPWLEEKLCLGKTNAAEMSVNFEDDEVEDVEARVGAHPDPPPTVPKAREKGSV